MTVQVSETVAANPFVGPRPYERKDRLYGRDGETEDLLDLLVAERVVLLHSPSGAGKTSLIQARLVPRLEQDGFRVHPIVRSNHELPSTMPGGAPRPNRYVLSTLLSFEEALPSQAQRPVAELAGLGIAQYLAEAARVDGAPANSVLVFDQFEEVVTTDPTDRDDKIEFFRQVGAALRDRSLWALFAIREDFLAELDPYARFVPTRFANRYRLDLLETDAALEAITRSAADAGITFHPTAAQALVTDLSRVKVQRLGKVEEEYGRYIEPVQLQVVCQQIWDRLAPGARSIDPSDVEGVGDVNQALRSYYAASLERTATTTGTDEGLLRDWVDRELITPQGFRAQTLYGPHHAAGPDGAVLADLIDRHLLRSESRRGAVWHELAHDRLVEPIRDNNARWRAEHLSELERRAALWDEQGRGDDLLLTGPGLTDAATEFDRTGKQPLGRELDFLEASRRRQRDTDRMERARRRTKRWLVVAVVCCVLALAGCIVAYVSYRVADQQRARAEIVGMVGRTAGVALRSSDLALALGVRAADLAGADAPDEPTQNLLQSVLDTNQVITPFRAAGSPPRTVGYSEDGRFVATGNVDGTVRIWDAGGRLVDTRSANGEIWSVAFGPAHGTDPPPVAAATSNGLSIWPTPGAPASVTNIAISAQAAAVAFDHVGTRLAAGSGDGSVLIYDVATGTQVVQLRPSDAATTLWISDVVWMPGDRQVAAVSSDGHLIVWDVGSPAPVTTISAHASGTALAVAADGRRIATGGESNVAIWDLASGTEPRRIYTLGLVNDVDLSADGSRLLVADNNGLVLPYDANTGTALYADSDYGPQPLQAKLDPTNPDRAVVAVTNNAAAVYNVSAAHAEAPAALATADDGTVITGAGDDGTLRLWSADGRSAGTVQTGASGIADVAISRDGRVVATLDEEGRARVHALRPETELLHAGSEAGLTAIALSSDGMLLATAEPDFTVTITDVARQTVTTMKGGHTSTVTGLSFDRSNGVVASVSNDQTLVVWREGKRAGKTRLGGSPSAASPYKVAWSPDGRLIATSGRGDTPQVWDARSLDERAQLRDHTLPVNDIRFDSSGGRLVTTSNDQELAIWESDTGKLISRRSFSSWGREAAFSADGGRVYVIGRRGAPYVDYIEPRQLLEVARQRVTREISESECERYVQPAGRCGGG